MKKILIITCMALFIALFINSKTVQAQQIEPEPRPPVPARTPSDQLSPEIRPPEVPKPEEDKPIQDEPEPRPPVPKPQDEQEPRPPKGFKINNPS